MMLGNIMVTLLIIEIIYTWVHGDKTADRKNEARATDL